MKVVLHEIFNTKVRACFKTITLVKVFYPTSVCNLCMIYKFICVVRMKWIFCVSLRNSFLELWAV